jgi:hypothetical protein
MLLNVLNVICLNEEEMHFSLDELDGSSGWGDQYICNIRTLSENI